MAIRYQIIAQPINGQVGAVIHDLVSSSPPPSKATFVSAFATRELLWRFEERLKQLQQAKSRVVFVLGIDLDGTSREVLALMLELKIETWIITQKPRMMTFHPKLYLFEWPTKATTILGSNNLTPGGFYTNFEASTLTTFDLPEDQAALDRWKTDLGFFLNPAPPWAERLDTTVLQRLEEEGLAKPESVIRQQKARVEVKGTYKPKAPTPPLPSEWQRSIPPLPSHRQKEKQEAVAQLTKDTPKGKKDDLKTAAKILTKAAEPAQLEAEFFFMTLPKLQWSQNGKKKKIPGEGRIPLPAIYLNTTFWNWPGNYTPQTSPRKGVTAGVPRTYLEWHAVWRVFDTEDPANANTLTVRMYMYENSSDFRFYCRPIVNMGADTDDIVRFTKIDAEGIDYECALSKKGSPLYPQWLTHCTQPVRNSTRKYGYA